MEREKASLVVSILSWSIGRAHPKLSSSLRHRHCFVSHISPHSVLFIFAYLREKKKRRIYLSICLSTCLSIYQLFLMCSSVPSTASDMKQWRVCQWVLAEAPKGTLMGEGPVLSLWLAFMSLWLTCRVRGRWPGSQGPCFSRAGPITAGELVPSIHEWRFQTCPLDSVGTCEEGMGGRTTEGEKNRSIIFWKSPEAFFSFHFSVVLTSDLFSQ